MRHTTFDTEQDMIDRAVLVSLVTQDIKRSSGDPEHSLEELISLAETAGVEVLSTMVQNKEARDSKWFIGKGKVEELKAMADELGGTTAIFDQELSGAQVRNLEEALDVKIIDRTQLILDIFAQRAKTVKALFRLSWHSSAICCQGYPVKGRTYHALAVESEREVRGNRSWRPIADISAAGSTI